VPPAIAAGMKVRAYVSTVFGCPYEGDVDPKAAVWLTKELRAMGVYQVSISDTIGVANPFQVERVLEQVLAEAPVESIAVHFHDTQGTALANCVSAMQQGVTTIDAAVGGLGGCPYAPGASGTLATDDLVAMLHSMGIQTGIDLDKLVEASRLAAAASPC
jgi:hydroxymethylglutaryl-CoA lyase